MSTTSAAREVLEVESIDRVLAVVGEEARAEATADLVPLWNVYVASLQRVRAELLAFYGELGDETEGASA